MSKNQCKSDHQGTFINSKVKSKYSEVAICSSTDSISMSFCNEFVEDHIYTSLTNVKDSKLTHEPSIPKT